MLTELEALILPHGFGAKLNEYMLKTYTPLSSNFFLFLHGQLEHGKILAFNLAENGMTA